MRSGKLPRYRKRIDKEVYEKVQLAIAKMLMDGFTTNEIHAEVLMEIPAISNSDFKEMLRYVYDQQRETIHKDRRYVFSVHMNRYEQIFNREMRLVGFNQMPLDRKKDWNLIVGKYSNAMKALKQKEELMGLHVSGIAIFISENDKAQIVKPLLTNSRSQTNMLENLTLEEQIELLALLKQCRVEDEEGVRKLMIKNAQVPQLTGNVQAVDTKFEELPEKVVDKLEQVIVELKEPEPEPVYDPLEAVDRQDPSVVAQRRAASIDKVRSRVNQDLLSKFDKLMTRDKRKKT